MHEAGAAPQCRATVRGYRHPDKAVLGLGAGRRRGSVRLHNEARLWAQRGTGPQIFPPNPTCYHVLSSAARGSQVRARFN